MSASSSNNNCSGSWFVPLKTPADIQTWLARLTPRHLTVRPLLVREPHDFDTAFANMERDPPDAGFMVVDGRTGSNRQRVIQFAAQQRIPFMYEDDFIVRYGGLLSYGPDLAEVGERQASLLDKILHGANAGDLPSSDQRCSRLL